LSRHEALKKVEEEAYTQEFCQYRGLIINNIIGKLLEEQQSDQFKTYDYVDLTLVHEKMNLIVCVKCCYVFKSDENSSNTDTHIICPKCNHDLNFFRKDYDPYF